MGLAEIKDLINMRLTFLSSASLILGVFGNVHDLRLRSLEHPSTNVTFVYPGTSVESGTIVRLGVGNMQTGLGIRSNVSIALSYPNGTLRHVGDVGQDCSTTTLLGSNLVRFEILPLDIGE